MIYFGYWSIPVYRFGFTAIFLLFYTIYKFIFLITQYITLATFIFLGGVRALVAVKLNNYSLHKNTKMHVTIVES